MLWCAVGGGRKRGARKQIYSSLPPPPLWPEPTELDQIWSFPPHQSEPHHHHQLCNNIIPIWKCYKWNTCPCCPILDLKIQFRIWLENNIIFCPRLVLDKIWVHRSMWPISGLRLPPQSASIKYKIYENGFLFLYLS